MGTIGGIVGAIILLGVVLALRCAPCEAWRWLRVLWVCRIPAVGVLAGFFLLVYTEQGRDLFSDLGLAWWQWIGFFVLIFVWAWLVHAVARSAVQYDDWVPDAHVVGALTPHRRNELRAEFYQAALWIPRILGALVFVCVAWGLLRAYANVHDAGAGLPLGRETIALSCKLLIGTIVTAIVYAVLVYKRRNVLHRLRGLQQPDPDVDPDYPLLTGAIPLQAVLREWARHVPPVRWLFAVISALWSALWWLLGWLCVLARWRFGLICPLVRIVRHWVQALAAWVRKLLHLPPAAPPTPAPVAQPPAVPAPPPEFPLSAVDHWLFVIGLGFWAVILTALWSPHSVAWFFPRALFVPVLIGGFVFATGWIAAWSHRLRTPLLLIVVLVGALLSFRFNHFHDVRWVSRQGVDASMPQQISFDEAVARWTKRNGCVPAAEGASAPDECRPIIIAGAGGASRAAFMTASLVGALIDLEAQEPEKYKNLRNRIFALSTVSGSSVGAVIIRAALTDAIANGSPQKPPCAMVRDGAWFGTARRIASARMSGLSWRDCFQQLIAGDFLSPVMVGIAFRDNFPLGNPVTKRAWWEDRAALLEQGFERRYAEVTGQGGLDCKEGTRSGLCRRFGYQPDPEKVNAWVPLLFINGTSVRTGRRIIVGDINAGSEIGDPIRDNNALFKLAYDSNDIRDADAKAAARMNNDLFLSTTSTMSARFPVISPQGVMRDMSDAIRDSIVDGGYFENQGLVTAGDLVRALERRGLEPIVIRVLNDPEKPESDSRRPPPLPASKSEPFEGSLSIVQAIYQTRSGHEDAAIQALRSELDRRPELGERFFTVSVYPLEPGTTPLCRASIPLKQDKKIDMKVVSMSWWMSQVVQAYLDAQLCVPGNVQQLECQLRAKRPRQCP